MFYFDILVQSAVDCDGIVSSACRLMFCRDCPHWVVWWIEFFFFWGGGRKFQFSNMQLQISDRGDMGPYLPKLLQEKIGAVFLAHPVYWSTEQRLSLLGITFTCCIHMSYNQESDQTKAECCAVACVSAPIQKTVSDEKEMTKHSQTKTTIRDWSGVVLIYVNTGFDLCCMREHELNECTQRRCEKWNKASTADWLNWSPYSTCFDLFWICCATSCSAFAKTGHFVSRFVTFEALIRSAPDLAQINAVSFLT